MGSQATPRAGAGPEEPKSQPRAEAPRPAVPPPAAARPGIPGGASVRPAAFRPAPVLMPATSAPAAPPQGAPQGPAPLEEMPVLELVAADVAPATTPAAADSRPWPLNAPDAHEALELLQDPESSPAWTAHAQKVLGTLTPLEKSLLHEEVTPDALAPLKAAALFRLRLAAMLATAPKHATDPVDGAALEAALVEGDAVLAALPPSLEMDAALKPAFDGARASVARDVVALSEVTQKLAPRPAEAPAVGAPRAATAKLTSIESASEATRGRVPWRYAVLAVALLAAGGFQAFQWLNPPPPRPPTLGEQLGFPHAALVSQDRSGNMLVFIPKGVEVEPAALERLRQRADAQGKVVREAAPGLFQVVPPTMGVKK